MGTDLKAGDRVVMLSDGGYEDLGWGAGDLGTVTYVEYPLARVEVDGNHAVNNLTWFIEEEIMKVSPDVTDTGGFDPKAAMDDVIHKPSHYAKWQIEPITFIMRNGFEFWRGNIIKYASRAGSKIYDNMDEVESEITDLKKAIRYAEMRINQLNGETEL